jgi:hypothetical protein
LEKLTHRTQLQMINIINSGQHLSERLLIIAKHMLDFLYTDILLAKQPPMGDMQARRLASSACSHGSDSN